MPLTSALQSGRLAAFVRFSTDVLIEIAPTGHVGLANDAAGAFFGSPPRTLIGRSVYDLVRAESRAALGQALDRLASGASTDEALSLAVATSRARLDCRLTAVCDGSGPQVVYLVGRRESEQTTRAQQAAQQADRLRLLHTVTAPSAEPAEARIRRALRLTAEILDLDAGLLSHISGDTYTVRVAHAPGGGIAPGDTFDLAETYCALTVGAGEVFATEHMGASVYRTHPCYLGMGLETYAGVPVHGDGGVVGTLCFFSAVPRATPFTEADLDLLRVLAVWVGGTLQQEQQARTLADGDALVRGLYEAAPLLMGIVEIVCDEHGTPADILHRSDNAATADFFGTTPDAMRDRTASEMGAAPESIARWLDAYRRTTETGQPARFKLEQPSAHGVRVLASTVSMIAPADAAQGRRGRYCYVTEDVTEARRAEQALVESERRQRVLSEATFEGILFSRAGVVLDANAQFLELYGAASAADVVGQTVSGIVAPEHTERVMAHIRSGSTLPCELLAVRLDGTRFWAEAQGREYPDYDADGPARITAIRDISQRKAVEAEVRFQSNVLAHVSDSVVAVDLDGRVTYWNSGAERLHGLPEADVLGRLLHEVVRYAAPDADLEAEDDAAAPDVLGTLRQAVGASGDLHYDGPRGRRVLSVLASVLTDERGHETGLLAVARDVTPQRRMAQRLRHQALHDALTGLPNRLALRRRVERSLAAGRPFGLLFVDLDHFKGINDTLGHDAGDQLLLAVAERMRAALRAGDVVARLGGDEFCVLVRGTARQVRATAARLLGAIGGPVVVGPRRVVPSASIGIVADARRYDSADELLRDADTAMYDAKRAGRGRASVFGAAMHHAAAQRFETEADLRVALAGDQLRLRLQPIVELATGTVVGVESLVRWQHPTRGLLGPAEFVPLAEDIGLIADIDGWVLDATCREVAGWREARPSLLMVSVNCSDQAVLAEGLAERALRAAEAAGLPPSCLTLELTERALVDSPAALATIAAIRAHGLQLCIDDFGTGYSSLGLLHRLPADGLKIDRSFVADLVHSATARAVVRAIVRLADDLGLRLVAEGIETEAQWAQLRELGCRYGQGFFFARPLEPAHARAVVGRPLPAFAHL